MEKIINLGKHWQKSSNSKKHSITKGENYVEIKHKQKYKYQSTKLNPENVLFLITSFIQSFFSSNEVK